jgi:hypothetical protein
MPGTSKVFTPNLQGILRVCGQKIRGKAYPRPILNQRQMDNGLNFINLNFNVAFSKAYYPLFSPLLGSLPLVVVKNDNWHFLKIPAMR